MLAGLKTLTLALVAAVTNGITTTQTLGAAGNLTLNGSLVSGGVATFDVARRVGITSVGNDTGINWTVTGTDRYGRPQTETFAGATTSSTAQSTRDFLTVTKIASSGATAGNVTAGTTSTGSTAPYITDYVANPAIHRCDVTQVGTATWTIEESIDDIAPAYDMTTSNPHWFSETNLTAKSANTSDFLNGPLTMVRLTITSGTGAVTARIAVPRGGA